MSTLSVTLPDSVREGIERMAREDGVSVEDFIATVLSQRMAVAEADSYVRSRAERGSAERLKQILDRAPDVEPAPDDRISPHS